MEGYYNYLHGNTREEQIEYLQNKMAAYHLYDTGLTVAKEDELLSLSTCEYSSTNGRLIVLVRRRCANEKKEYRNRDNSIFIDMIRQSLKELEDKEFILQIPLEKEVTEDERKVRT